MNSQKKALGMGLSGLMSSDVKKNTVLEIEVHAIKPNPKQPRIFFDEDKITELAQSIKENGLIQPVIVVKKGDDYFLIAGERRLRAAKSLGHNKIRAIVATTDEAGIIKHAIIENIQREDLNTIEEAMGYEMMSRELNLTHQEIASQVGKSRSHVSNMIRVLSLPEEIITLLNKSKISFGHAKVLLSVDNPLDFLHLFEEEISVRKLEDAIRGKVFASDEVEKDVSKTFFQAKNNLNNTETGKLGKSQSTEGYLQDIVFQEDIINAEMNIESADKINQHKSSFEGESSPKKSIFNLIKNIYNKERDLTNGEEVATADTAEGLQAEPSAVDYSEYVKNLEVFNLDSFHHAISFISPNYYNHLSLIICNQIYELYDNFFIIMNLES
jgi:ParB family chromosome partitioning protein